MCNPCCSVATRSLVCSLETKKISRNLRKPLPTPLATNSLRGCIELLNKLIEHLLPLYTSKYSAVANMRCAIHNSGTRRVLTRGCLIANYYRLSKVKVTLRPRSVGQSIQVSDLHLGPATNFSFTSLKIILIFVVFSMVCPLWREGGSVIYGCCWSYPALYLGSDIRGTRGHVLLPQP
jgi:hypothetical protein